MRETWVWSLGWKIPWRREWLPTPLFLSGEFHGQRSLAGHSLWGHKESGHNWATNTFTFAYWPGHWEGRGLFQEVRRKGLYVLCEESKACIVQKEDEASQQLSLPPKVEFQTHDFTWPVPLTGGTTVWTEVTLSSQFSSKGKHSRAGKYWLGPFSGPHTGIQRRTESLGPFSEPSCAHPERTSSHCPSITLVPPVFCLRSPSGIGGPHSFTGCQEK